MDNIDLTSLAENSSEEEQLKDAIAETTTKPLSPLSRYNRLLRRKPLLTKAVTSALVGALGSALGTALAEQPQQQQRKSSHRHRLRIDWLEVFAFSLHGVVLHGPFDYYWSKWLEQNGPKSKGKSLLLDQLIIEPYRLVAMYLFLDITKKIMREIPDSLSRTISTVGPTIVHSWRCWPILIYCTFRFLKKKHHPITLNLSSFLWIAYLSKKRALTNKKIL